MSRARPLSTRETVLAAAVALGVAVIGPFAPLPVLLLVANWRGMIWLLSLVASLFLGMKWIVLTRRSSAPNMFKAKVFHATLAAWAWVWMVCGYAAWLASVSLPKAVAVCAWAFYAWLMFLSLGWESVLNQLFATTSSKSRRQGKETTLSRHIFSEMRGRVGSLGSGGWVWATDGRSSIGRIYLLVPMSGFLIFLGAVGLDAFARDYLGDTSPANTQGVAAPDAPGPSPSPLLTEASPDGGSNDAADGDAEEEGADELATTNEEDLTADAFCNYDVFEEIREDVPTDTAFAMWRALLHEGATTIGCPDREIIKLGDLYVAMLNRGTEPGLVIGKNLRAVAVPDGLRDYAERLAQLEQLRRAGRTIGTGVGDFQVFFLKQGTCELRIRYSFGVDAVYARLSPPATWLLVKETERRDEFPSDVNPTKVGVTVQYGPMRDQVSIKIRETAVGDAYVLGNAGPPVSSDVECPPVQRFVELGREYAITWLDSFVTETSKDSARRE